MRFPWWPLAFAAFSVATEEQQVSMIGLQVYSVPDPLFSSRQIVELDVEAQQKLTEEFNRRSRSPHTLLPTTLRHGLLEMEDGMRLSKEPVNLYPSSLWLRRSILRPALGMVKSRT